jgi:hypothetical protein
VAGRGPEGRGGGQGGSGGNRIRRGAPGRPRLGCASVWVSAAGRERTGSSRTIGSGRGRPIGASLFIDTGRSSALALPRHKTASRCGCSRG